MTESGDLFDDDDFSAFMDPAEEKQVVQALRGLLYSAESLTEQIPGRFLTLQAEDEEYDELVQLYEQIDLPPDTSAILLTPSAYRDTVETTSSLFFWDDTPPEDLFILVIADPTLEETLIHITLTHQSLSGIDVYKADRKFLDYSYTSVRDCLIEVNKIIWLFLKPKKTVWSVAQIEQYTENWLFRGAFRGQFVDLPVHGEFNYLFSPDRVGRTPVETCVRALSMLVRYEYEGLEDLIDTVNDLQMDLDISGLLVTRDGIEKQALEMEQELLSFIALSMDQWVTVLAAVDGVTWPTDRTGIEYSSAMEATARALYQSYTGHLPPEGFRPYT
ncbi:MAG: hypothetical protein CSA22_06220 [Deltaproteobacteria bacterium]|nr:MAG: hypothetical protein CSA22_06220 [Deltaproteobacteria bacterium]